MFQLELKARLAYGPTAYFCPGGIFQPYLHLPWFALVKFIAAYFLISNLKILLLVKAWNY